MDSDDRTFYFEGMKGTLKAKSYPAPRVQTPPSDTGRLIVCALCGSVIATGDSAKRHGEWHDLLDAILGTEVAARLRALESELSSKED